MQSQYRVCDKRMLKGGSRCIFLLVTLVDAVFKMCTSYYP